VWLWLGAVTWKDDRVENGNVGETFVVVDGSAQQ